MELSERQKKGLKKSNETNKLKGFRTFVKNTYTKQYKKYNELLDNLIKTGYYAKIYEKYLITDDVDIIRSMPAKVYDILTLMDFCDPDEFANKYRGFYIEKILGVVDVNLTKK